MGKTPQRFEFQPSQGPIRMIPSPENDLPLYDPDQHDTYTLDIVARITGISTQTIIHYQEHGLVHPVGKSGEFDDDAVHTLRRIEHLRQTCEANLSGLRLILGLMDEVERLKTSLRTGR